MIAVVNREIELAAWRGSLRSSEVSCFVVYVSAATGIQDRECDFMFGEKNSCLNLNACKPRAGAGGWFSATK